MGRRPLTSERALRRREQLLEIALEQFLARDYEDVSVDEIAKLAGVSHGLVFQYFGSKKDLYIASVRRCYRRTLEVMQAASEGLRGEAALDAMGEAYAVLLSTDPVMLQAQLQSYAAALDDEDVRRAVREGYGDLYTYVERVSSASSTELADFFAKGMLLNVVGAMGLHDEPEPELWAARLMAGCQDLHIE